MNDDYLWDRSGDVDPEVARLEQLLARHRYEKPLRVHPRSRVRFARRAWVVCAAMLALIVLSIGGAVWFRLQWQADRAWDVLATHGNVTIDGHAVHAHASLAVGALLRTGPQSTATIRVARIGELQVGPSSAIRLQTTGRRHRIVLERGTVSSRIWAPPFAFSVQTPAGLASDLGCAFDISFLEHRGQIRVTSGWIDFDGPRRSALIPEHAVAELHPDGPGTPYYPDASSAFVDALRAYDRGEVAALASILEHARPRDVMTLLHLMERGSQHDRALLFARAAQLAPPPSDVTLTRILTNERTGAIDDWRRAIGLRGIKRWWLNWKDALPERRRGRRRSAST